jgi:hypothetical protein
LYADLIIKESLAEIIGLQFTNLLGMLTKDRAFALPLVILSAPVLERRIYFD